MDDLDTALAPLKALAAAQPDGPEKAAGEVAIALLAGFLKDVRRIDAALEVLAAPPPA